MNDEIKAAEEAIEASNAQAQQEQGEDNIPEESPTTESTTGEEESTEEEVATESEGEDLETEGGTKKGAEKRIKQLVKERDEERNKAKSLENRLKEISGQGSSSPQEQYQFPQVEPGQEITAEQYQSDVSRTADAIVQIRLRQSEAVNRINNEARDVLAAYPQLNPESDQFDSELSEAVTEAVEPYVRANPYSASVKQFVTKLMKPYTKGVSREVGKATENIAKQVSEAALRPSSVRKGEKTADEKSIAELEAELGFQSS